MQGKPLDDTFRAAEHVSKARDLHNRIPLCDGHNDLPWFIRELSPNGKIEGVNSLDLTQNHKGKVYDGVKLHTDIPRLRQGAVGWQFWSVYTPASDSGPIAVQLTLEQIDIVHRLIKKYPTTFEMANSATDVRRIFSEGKIASMCGIEGGHQINNSLGVLRMYYNLGCRYMTLTHNGGPLWADSALSVDEEHLADAPHGGLSRFGCEVVREMNRIGMLVDLSHVHPVTMKKAIEVSRAPVIFSHSSSRALCNVRAAPNILPSIGISQ